jgi:hypothetical protein
MTEEDVPTVPDLVNTDDEVTEPILPRRPSPLPRPIVPVPTPMPPAE